MRLNSTAFADGSAIPRRFTCDGDDLSPPLSWSDAPTGTRSFVLLCDDPDAPAGTWHHWAAYDIPSTVTAFAERAASDAEKRGFKQAVNDFQRPGYGGPCPPRGRGPHHYHFRLLALSVDGLSLGHTPSCRKTILSARAGNIDSRTAINAQHRFKNCFPRIRLLRASRLPPSFATKSARLGPAETPAIRSLSGGKRTLSKPRT